MVTGVSYDKIDDKGLHYTKDEKQHVLEVDTIILCAGQVSEKSLFQPLTDMGKKVHLIGGSAVAAELDAKAAINQATRLALEI
jgi:2,4-dienoyl-CoA reductase (NADPH2)